MYGVLIGSLSQRRRHNHNQSTAQAAAACHQHKRTATAATSGKDMTHKKPQTSSAQLTVDPPHGGHVGMPVEQFDLKTGETIARFISRNAAQRATGIDHSSISSFISGKSKHAGGFGWRRPGTEGAADAATGSPLPRPASSKPSTGTYFRHRPYPRPYI